MNQSFLFFFTCSFFVLGYGSCFCSILIYGGSREYDYLYNNDLMRSSSPFKGGEIGESIIMQPSGIPLSPSIYSVRIFDTCASGCGVSYREQLQFREAKLKDPNPEFDNGQCCIKCCAQFVAKVDRVTQGERRVGPGRVEFAAIDAIRNNHLEEGSIPVK